MAALIGFLFANKLCCISIASKAISESQQSFLIGQTLILLIQVLVTTKYTSFLFWPYIYCARKIQLFSSFSSLIRGNKIEKDQYGHVNHVLTVLDQINLALSIMC
jgi:hypothetical protein